MARILVADDEAKVRRVMQIGLKNAGHSVTLAENGAVALAEVESAAPDVLITDIEMPQMSGRALCELLAQRYPKRRFPIFVLTSLAEREHRAWAGAIPDLHFLEKPVSMRTLVAQIQTRLGAKAPAGGES